MKLPFFDLINDLYNSNRVFQSAPHSLWATTSSSCSVLLQLAFRHFKWGMNVSFLSNIIPRNLYSSTTGISEPSFRLGSLCSLFFFDKIGYVFVLENLNPFTVAHLLIFFSPYCSFHSIVWIYLDLKHIMRSSMYKNPSIPDGNSLIIFFILMLKIYCLVGYPLPDFSHLKVWSQHKL